MRSKLAVLVVLWLAACGAIGPQDVPARDDPQGKESEDLVGTTTEADANPGFTLAVEPDPVAPGAEVDLVIVNERDEPLEVGAEYALDRWDGQEWSNALDCEELCAWPDILYVIDPGDEHRLPLVVPDEPGSYRIAKTANDGLTAAAAFEAQASGQAGLGGD